MKNHGEIIEEVNVTSKNCELTHSLKGDYGKNGSKEDGLGAKNQIITVPPVRWIHFNRLRLQVSFSTARE